MNETYFSLFEVRAGKVSAIKNNATKKILILKEPIDLSDSSKVLSEISDALAVINKHIKEGINEADYRSPICITQYTPKLDDNTTSLIKEFEKKGKSKIKFDYVNREIKEFFRTNPTEEFSQKDVLENVRKTIITASNSKIYILLSQLKKDNYIFVSSKSAGSRGALYKKVPLISPEQSPAEKTASANKERDMRAGLLKG